MKNNIIVIGFIVLIGLFFFSCAQQQTNVIRIGFAAPLTGDQAEIGIDMKNGVLMAIEEANAAGGVLGKKLELVPMDDKHDPKEAVAVAQKLITDPTVVAVVGHLNSNCSIPASKKYHEAQLAMITPSSTNPELTLQGYPEIFRMCATDSFQGPFGAEFAIKELGKKRIAILHDKSQYGQGLAEEFRKGVHQLGLKEILFEGITQGDRDFTAILTKIKSKNPDLVYFGGMYPEAGLLAKQMKELGMQTQFMGGDGLYVPGFLDIAGKAAEGTIITFSVPSWDKVETAKQFINKFTAKYGAIKTYAPFAYDAANIIIDAIKRAGTTDRAAVVKAIRETKDFNGVVGITNFDEHGDTTNKAMYVYIVKEGKFVQIK
ncbi:MAG: branched-chain amino acid ABC transporter substrate-binding protein [bacterium]|nr:branched-chain amino acid ABC transporter substrate-binding protein [bacterium]